MERLNKNIGLLLALPFNQTSETRPMHYKWIDSDTQIQQQNNQNSQTYKTAASPHNKNW